MVRSSAGTWGAIALGLVVLGACGAEESDKRCSEDPSACFTPLSAVERPKPDPKQVSCNTVCSHVYYTCNYYMNIRGDRLSFDDCLVICEDWWEPGKMACVASMSCDYLNECMLDLPCVHACYNLGQCRLDGFGGGRTGTFDAEECVDECKKNHAGSASCVSYVRDCAEDEFALCGVGE